MGKKRIGIIFGGRSGEHQVSLQSAASVIRAIDKDKFELKYIGIDIEGQWKTFEGTPEEIEDGTWKNKGKPFNPWELKDMVDFALPIMHGPYCEDGRIQGLFEMMDIPYGGCGVLASAVAMDKLAAKDIFAKNGLPVCKHVGVKKSQVSDGYEGVIVEIEENIGYPNFVKPANLGSSVGISKAMDRKTLEEALELAFTLDKRVIVEEFIDCREIETAILGNGSHQVATVGEILPSEEFYDYKAKYCDDGASKLCIPADLPQDTIEKIRKMAVHAYEVIDGEGFARVDFFIEKHTGEIYLNEINTIPGFTKYSMFPLLWEGAGMKYSDTIERIIELGYERYYAKNQRNSDI